MQTKVTPNTDTFYVVYSNNVQNQFFFLLSITFKNKFGWFIQDVKMRFKVIKNKVKSNKCNAKKT